MGSNDTYLDDLRQIEQLASSVRNLIDRENQIQLEINSLESYLSNLSPMYDEDGYDLNEAERNSVESQISSLEFELDDVRDERQGFSARAKELSSFYSRKSHEMQARSRNHDKAANVFGSLTNRSFGATTAAAGASAASQHSRHYEDHSRILMELSMAASAAASGKLSQVSSGISDRGSFTVPGVVQNNTGVSVNKAQNIEKTPVDPISRNHIVNNSMFQTLGLSSPAEGDAVNLTHVSGASVLLDGGNTEVNATQADAVLASQWGTTSDQIAQYRRENGFVWVADSGGRLQMVPNSVVQEYQIPKTMSGSSPKDALSAYMCAHNYGKEDYSVYSQDPEWQQLHRRAFPEAHNENAVLVRERRAGVQSALTAKGITSGEMDGYIVSSPFENGRYFVAGGERHLKFLEFEENWYRDYKKDEKFSPQQSVIDSSLIEGVEVNRDDMANSRKFWGQHDLTRTKESYVEIARDIPIVQERLNRGESLDSILNDPHVGTCACMYFRNPIEVYEVNDFYVFGSDGRHRVLAAQELGYNIPVRVSTKYIPK